MLARAAKCIVRIILVQRRYEGCAESKNMHEAKKFRSRMCNRTDYGTLHIRHSPIALKKVVLHRN